MKNKNQLTLYERIGGKEAVNKAVEIFYQKILQDDLIKHFFNDIDMKLQVEKQKSFLTYAFGGPVNYSGKDLASAHSRLVANGLDHKHFDAVAQHLQNTLVQLGLTADLVDEVMQLVGSTRGDVLGH